eukprot:GILI01051186.1.p1 GENE.GILI01051186.1~~GILI01051186.1.p1  ORF type:complete len:187 (+),score=33.14 GILI01051186.1:68-562(+)
MKRYPADKEIQMKGIKALGMCDLDLIGPKQSKELMRLLISIRTGCAATNREFDSLFITFFYEMAEELENLKFMSSQNSIDLIFSSILTCAPGFHYQTAVLLQSLSLLPGNATKIASHKDLSAFLRVAKANKWDTKAHNALSKLLLILAFREENHPFIVAAVKGK